MELAEVGVSATQIFAILNPISVIPIFLSLTEGRGEAELRRVIKVTSITIFAMMVLFSVAGDLILGTLGITVRGLKLGGGAILLVLAVDMLQGMPRTKSVEEEELAVVPLATPLLMGPGTMTTILLLSSKYSREYGYLASSLMLVAASLIVTVLTYLILVNSRRLRGLLGMNGIRGLGRFMAIIVAATAADMISSGLLDLLG
ncbi:MAG: MarC family protein [Candidatus Korarchaeum sp.]